MASSPTLLTTLLILSAALAFLAPSSFADYVMLAGDTLNGGQSLSYGNYVFTMQTDCNLVLYDSSQAVWSSGTNNKGTGCNLRMQKDGNLVIYNGSNKAIWASNTAKGQSNYVLVLQRDRNVVIYGPAIWATGSNRAGTAAVVISGNSTKSAVVAGDDIGKVFVAMQSTYIFWSLLVEERPRATIASLFMSTCRGILGSSTQLPLPKEFLGSGADFPVGNVSFFLFFSGHVAGSMIASLDMRRMKRYKMAWSFDALNMLQAIRLLASRGHYTIDLATGLGAGFLFNILAGHYLNVKNQKRHILAEEDSRFCRCCCNCKQTQDLITST